MLRNERGRYWDNIANNVNETCGTEYTAKQCKSKFNKLVSDYRVSDMIIITFIYNNILKLNFFEYFNRV